MTLRRYLATFGASTADFAVPSAVGTTVDGLAPAGNSAEAELPGARNGPQLPGLVYPGSTVVHNGAPVQPLHYRPSVVHALYKPRNVEMNMTAGSALHKVAPRVSPHTAGGGGGGGGGELPPVLLQPVGRLDKG